MCCAPGNAGSNTAIDHLDVLCLALAQLPVTPQQVPMLARSDSADATHGFLAALRDAGVMFCVGFDATAAVRDAVLAVPAAAWVAARRQSGGRRDGAQVAELHGLDLSAWPAGTRAIVRRERPHPGAQLTFSDADGHRFQVFITDQPDTDIAELERRHRAHARVEDRIRAAKNTGLRNLPCADFQRNQVWLELVLVAQDLLACAQRLCLDGDLAVAEPKALRYRLLHVAARIVRHARRTTIRLQADWPWVHQLAAAFARVAALPG